jgi:nucleotide-binding universal stress UspA family protein
MTRVVIGYDGSASARAAVAAAAALFPAAEAAVVCVYASPPALEPDSLARLAVPEAMLDETLAEVALERADHAAATAGEGAALAHSAGLAARSVVVDALSTWRALRDQGAAGDLIVCGTRGLSSTDRILLGSTTSSLVHHLSVPLLVVPTGGSGLGGPVYAGWDGSDGARRALRFAAAHLRGRRQVIAHAWHSPVRHSLRGHALASSSVHKLSEYAASVDQVYADTARERAGEGVEYARELGLAAEPDTPESGHGDWQTLLAGARAAGAVALLVGSRGRGAVAATALGSVTSGLVHAAALPVLVVPDA